jgi:hypothetical protein
LDVNVSSVSSLGFHFFLDKKETKTSRAVENDQRQFAVCNPPGPVRTGLQENPLPRN